MKIKENKGITLVALVITIIILLIIAGIGINYGTDTIRRANLEELRTNMLLIEAKAKGLVEEANFQYGPQQDGDLSSIRSSIYVSENKMEVSNNIQSVNIDIPSSIPIGDNVYVMTEETYTLWGMEDIYNELEKGEGYLISFDEENATLEVYNTLGYNGKYSLTEIDSIEE